MNNNCAAEAADCTSLDKTVRNLKKSLDKKKTTLSRGKPSGKAKSTPRGKPTKSSAALPYETVITLGRIEEMLDQIETVEGLVQQLVRCTVSGKRKAQA